MNEKVYEVTAVLRVYAQTSKQDVKDWLEEALHVDGLEVVSTTEPKIIKPEQK